MGWGICSGVLYSGRRAIIKTSPCESDQRKTQCVEAKSQVLSREGLNRREKVAVLSLNTSHRLKTWAILRVHGETHCVIYPKRFQCSGIEMRTKGLYSYHGRSCIIHRCLLTSRYGARDRRQTLCKKSAELVVPIIPSLL